MNEIRILNKPYDIVISSPLTTGGSQTVTITGVFEHESSGMKIELESFEYSPEEARIRYSLPLEGRWTFRIDGSWSERCLEAGTLYCENNPETRYPVEVTSSKIRPIFTQNSRPYFMSMYECNWLFALWMSNERDAREYLATIRKHKFNSIAMNIYAHSCAWTKEGTPGRLVPPPLFNWKGSNEAPDFSAINPEFYKRFDELMDCMYELDLVAHLYFFVWNKGNSYPEPGSAEESEYVSYIVRRYQAYPNVIWDYCKESYLRFDKEHVRRLVELIKDKDSYNRLVTVHDDKLVQYDVSFDPLLDFYTMQIKHDYYSKTLREIEKGTKPVFTAEYTYESGRDLNDKTFEVAHTYEDHQLISWELAIAGSGTCYYYTFSAWDVIRVDDRPQGFEGHRILVDFFESFDWWNYTAVPEENHLVRTVQACAKHIDNPHFVLLTDKSGRMSIVVDFEKYNITGEWVDIYTGERQAIRESDFTHEFNSQIIFLMCPFAKQHGDMGFCLAKLEMTEK